MLFIKVSFCREDIAGKLKEEMDGALPPQPPQGRICP